MTRGLARKLWWAMLSLALVTAADARDSGRKAQPPSAPVGAPVSDSLRYDPSSRLYAAACASCHYKGAARADFSARSAIGEAKPDELVEAILFGKDGDDDDSGVGMPAFGGALNDSEIAALARHLRATLTTKAPWPGLEPGVAALRRAGDAD